MLAATRKPADRSAALAGFTHSSACCSLGAWNDPKDPAASRAVYDRACKRRDKVACTAIHMQ